MTHNWNCCITCCCPAELQRTHTHTHTHTTVWGPTPYPISANERRVCWLCVLRATWGYGGEITGRPSSIKGRWKINHSLNSPQVILILLLSHLTLSPSFHSRTDVLWLRHSERGFPVPTFLFQIAGPLMLVQWVTTEIWACLGVCMCVEAGGCV